MPQSEFNRLVNKIYGRIKSLEKKINIISIDVIKNLMGFPSNWYDIKK